MTLHGIIHSAYHLHAGLELGFFVIALTDLVVLSIEITQYAVPCDAIGRESDGEALHVHHGVVLGLVCSYFLGHALILADYVPHNLNG